MAFFEQFGKRVSDLGQGVAAKTRNFSDITRLNSLISEQEQQITNAYLAIGQSYYANHKDDPEGEEQEKIAYINDALQRVAQYQEQIKLIRGIATCPNCGAEISAMAPFCSACGKSTGFAPAQPKRTCPVCGAQVNEGTAFCTTCGNRLDQQEPTPMEPIRPVQQGPAAYPEPAQQGTQERLCPICHARLENGVQFCTTCGAHVPTL